ncbi:MAG: hypothetical protein OXP66_19580 [Candidatus Tectomicrobia bacterium]|nr:hypothetical protein [Candidatus Tectomicrobia bacterium]
MWWLRRLFYQPQAREADNALWLNVQCDRCGEIIGVRVDRRYDMASNMLDPGEEGPAYTMHKDVVGDRCFRRISVTLGFDRRMNVVEQDIRGGRLHSEPASDEA